MSAYATITLDTTPPVLVLGTIVGNYPGGRLVVHYTTNEPIAVAGFDFGDGVVPAEVFPTTIEADVPPLVDEPIARLYFADALLNGLLRTIPMEVGHRGLMRLHGVGRSHAALVRAGD